MIRPPQIVDGEIISTWRSMLKAEDLAACMALVRELDRRDPAAGWGSLEQADVLPHVPLLLNVLEQRAACAQCPGLRQCCDRPGMPRGAVARRLELHVDGGDRPGVRVWYGACDVRRRANDDAAEEVAERARRRRRRRGETADGQADDTPPF
jgi:hypothetical protein